MVSARFGRAETEQLTNAAEAAGMSRSAAPPSSARPALSTIARR